MPQYIGFSTVNACKPKNTNLQIDAASTSYTRFGPNGWTPLNGYGVTPSSGTIGNPLLPGKKFTTTDAQLVIQDLINAFNLPQGQKVGQPGYGSTIWNYIFEPNTSDLQALLENDIRTIVSGDPRITINYVKSYPQGNGLLVEVQLAVVPFNNPETLSVFFNQQTGSASLI